MNRKSGYSWSLFFLSLRYGFTLIELLLVTVLLSLLAFFSLPNFSHFYNRIQLDTTADRMVALMSYAKNRAVMEQRPVRLNFDDKWRNYVLVDILSADDAKEDGTIEQQISGRWGRTFSIPQELTVTGDSQVVNFSLDGRIDKIRINLCHRAECLLISTGYQRGRIKRFDAESPNP